MHEHHFNILMLIIATAALVLIAFGILALFS